MNNYPFIVGTTSYIYQADILTNVEKLASLIDDMELVLFTTGEEDNLPSRDMLNTIKEIAVTNNMGFTVHLPLITCLGDSNEASRSLSVRVATDIIELTSCINPRAWIIHLNADEPCHENTEKAWASWTELCLSSLKEIISATGNRGNLCIENLEGYDMTHLDPLLKHPGINLCLDIGHLWVQGKNPVRFIEQYADSIRVIHLHGIHERDHRSLAFMDFNEVKKVLDAIHVQHFSGVITLEVFSYENLVTSLKVLERWAGERGILQ